MALATSDLSVNSILSVLEVATAKAIFRNGDTLKTTDQLWAITNRWGLSAYCTGSTSALKLSNLRTDRKLSYFKGYNHTAEPFSTSKVNINFDRLGDTKTFSVNCLSSDYTWSIESIPSWIDSISATNGTGTTLITIVVGMTSKGYQQTATLNIYGLPKFHGGTPFSKDVYLTQDPL